MTSVGNGILWVNDGLWAVLIPLYDDFLYFQHFPP